MKKIALVLLVLFCICVGLVCWVWFQSDPGYGTARVKFYPEVKTEAVYDGLRARRFTSTPKVDLKQAPNVLVIAFDNVRADRMSCYGGPRPTTPNLDALAKKGVRFAHCVAQAPYTPHSFCSMFSSLYVSDLELRVRAQPKDGEGKKLAGIEPYNVTLPEAMQDAGYVTAGVIQGWFTEAFGLTDGFEWISYKERNLASVNDATLEWLREWAKGEEKRPFFMFSYSFDVHYEFMKGYGPNKHVFGAKHDGFNYTREYLSKITKAQLLPGDAGKVAAKVVNPSEEDLENALTLYDEGLYWADHEIQRLLDEVEKLGLSDNTIIAFVSDHGEEFGEHGFFSHGQSNFSTVIDVPLIIVDPRVQDEGGRVVEQSVMNIDIAPTILDLCDVPIPETAKGLSLAPSIRNSPQPELKTRGLYSEGSWNGFVGATWAGSHKFLMDQFLKPYLFDMENDPNETNNLADELPDLAGRLEEQLYRHKRDGMATQVLLKLNQPLTLNDWALPDAETVWTNIPTNESGASKPTLSQESLDQLNALGYLE